MVCKMYECVSRWAANAEKGGKGGEATKFRGGISGPDRPSETSIWAASQGKRMDGNVNKNSATQSQFHNLGVPWCERWSSKKSRLWVSVGLRNTHLAVLAAVQLIHARLCWKGRLFILIEKTKKKSSGTVGRRRSHGDTPISRTLFVAVPARLSQRPQQQPKEDHPKDKRQIQPLLPPTKILDVRYIGEAHHITKGVAETGADQIGCSQEQEGGEPAKEGRVEELECSHGCCAHQRLPRPALFHVGLVSVVDMRC